MEWISAGVVDPAHVVQWRRFEVLHSDGLMCGVSDPDLNTAMLIHSDLN